MVVAIAVLADFALNLTTQLFDRRLTNNLLIMYCKKVRRFSSLAAKKPLGNKPHALTKKEVDFLITMVNDEMEELKEAKDIGEQADALVDAIYYLLDGAAKKGINLDPIFSIVHKNNLTKVKNKKVVHSQEGKVLKPKDWKDPSILIKNEIKRQIKEGAFSSPTTTSTTAAAASASAAAITSAAAATSRTSNNSSPKKSSSATN